MNGIHNNVNSPRRSEDRTTSGTVFVTGASSGIGARTAEVMAARGYRVFGAARRTAPMEALDGVMPVRLDLSDDESIAAAVDVALSHGPVDIVINCAGYGAFGTIEETPIDAARAEMDVNVFGTMQLTRLFLPSMRTARHGRIVNVSSLAGEFSSPLGGWYHASKFALEALSDALRGEVAPFGIDVTVVQPSYVDTDWRDAAMDRLVSASGQGPYADMVDAMRAYFSSTQVAKQMSTVDHVASVIVKAATSRRPRTRYRVGRGSSVAVALSTALPDRAFDYITRKQFGYASPSAAGRGPRRLGD